MALRVGPRGLFGEFGAAYSKLRWIFREPVRVVGRAALTVLERKGVELALHLFP